MTCTARMTITVVALRVERKVSRFDLFGDLISALSRSGHELCGGDVLVISSKYAAISEGRTIRESGVIVSGDARTLARRFKMRESLAEAVLRESESVMGGVAGFAMALTGGILAPNSGIDSSNSGRGEIILYPADPYATAEQVRRKAFLELGVRIGVVIADSRLMPMRAGTGGVAIAFAGFVPVHDQRGELDLGGRPLVVTKRAVADSIAAMANHAMGEGSESAPFAVVRGAGQRLTDSGGVGDEASVSPEECVYARSMGSGRAS